MDGGNQPNSVPFKRNIHKGFCGKEQKEKKDALGQEIGKRLQLGGKEREINKEGRKKERNITRPQS